MSAVTLRHRTGPLARAPTGRPTQLLEVHPLVEVVDVALGEVEQQIRNVWFASRQHRREVLTEQHLPVFHGSQSRHAPLALEELVRSQQLSEEGLVLHCTRYVESDLLFEVVEVLEEDFGLAPENGLELHLEYALVLAENLLHDARHVRLDFAQEILQNRVREAEALALAALGPLLLALFLEIGREAEIEGPIGQLLGRK